MINFCESSKHKLCWGEIYYAIKKGFINAQYILDNYGTDKILFFTEGRYIEILIEIEESCFEVLKKIKRYIYEDDGFDLIHDENEIIEVVDFEYIPQKYKVFWDELFELSILNKVVNSNCTVLEKFYMLYLNHRVVNYKEAWREFINYYFMGNPKVDRDDIYLKFLNYYNDLKIKVKQ